MRKYCNLHKDKNIDLVMYNMTKRITCSSINHNQWKKNTLEKLMHHKVNKKNTTLESQTNFKLMNKLSKFKNLIIVIIIKKKLYRLNNL